MGAKRSGLVEASGLPVALVIDGANRNDFKRARATVEAIVVERPEPTAERPQGRCLDKGYDFDEGRALLKEFGFTDPLRARGEEIQALKQEAGYKAHRGVVERTPSGMNRFRRILIRWEKKATNYLGFLPLVCALFTFRTVHLLG